MSAITIKSLEETEVDGKPEGPLLPALARLGLDPAEVQSALYAWRDGLLREHAAAAAALTAERDTARATLQEHQRISDDLVFRAGGAIAAGDMDALKAVLTDAAMYPAQRRAAQLESEAENLRTALAAKEEEIARLTAESP